MFINCYHRNHIILTSGETMAKHGYSLRMSNRNYRKLTSVKLPKARKTSTKDKLYHIEVVEIDGSRARIHYVGYNDSDDEWRNLSELITIPPTPRSVNNRNLSVYDTPIPPYNLYKELRIKIKQGLICRTGKVSPSVVIDMGFDYLLFKGGLQAIGVTKQNTHGTNIRYKLRCYKDLDPLLGQNWHYRGANETGDYAFVILNTVEYYIHKRRNIIEYHPSQSVDTQSNPTLHTEDSGYALKFCFIRGYGNRFTFGKDKNIFNIS